MTIIESVRQVLANSEKPLTSREVTVEIVKSGLYPFKAADPHGVVREQMRRHCEGNIRAAAASKPCLKRIDKDRYVLL